MIKRFFQKLRGKTIDEVGDLEEELSRIKNKFKMSLVSFMGIQGNVKGLTLIHKADEGLDEKFFAGTFQEIYQGINVLKEHFLTPPLGLSVIRSADRSVVFGPVSKIIVFVGILSDKKYLDRMKDWFFRNEKKFKEIFTS